MWTFRAPMLALIVAFATHLGAHAEEAPPQLPASIEELKAFMKELEAEGEPLRRQSNSRYQQERITVRRNIVYKTDTGVDPQRLSLDLYLSQDRVVSATTREKMPILLYVHGGGWIGGSKESALFKPLAFVPARLVFASTNYRFVPEASLVEMAQSVADAIAWLRRNSADFGGDPERIVLMGHSAGAHLVSLIGTNHMFLKQAGVPTSVIRGVISLDTAVYDLPKLMRDPGRIHELIFAGNEANFEDASPWHHVRQGAPIPPFLVFYSDSRPEAVTQAIPFSERLVGAGHTAVVLEAKGRTHGSLDTEIGADGDRTTAEIFRFLDRHL